MLVPVTSSAIDAHHSISLTGGWRMLRAAPGQYGDVAQLPQQGWHDVVLPATVSELLGSEFSDDERLDSFDWWFRLELPELSGVDDAPLRLRFEGLATLADVWVDGRLLLQVHNMHRCHVVPLARCARVVALRFAALLPELQLRRPRPRWKTALVESQNLRWFRTTLLGRVSSWNPRVDIVGPWRPCYLETVRVVDVEQLRLAPAWRDGRAALHVGARWRDVGAGSITSAQLQVGACRREIDAARLREHGIEAHVVELDGIEPWWPHTHGRPALYSCVLRLRGPGGEVVIDGGDLGFKSFTLHEPDGALTARCNDTAVFLRGACWTAASVHRLDADEVELREVLARVVAAGMNMLRVVGTAVYPSPAFYAACDRLGILVWQDFMFANMDYPFDDPEFGDEARAEVEEVLRRLQRHACVALYCGGSEIEQQAAMLGLPREAWSHAFFRDWLPDVHARLHPGSAYVRSSPCGGELPFHASAGVSHYYGVGAYRRPVSDARVAGVRLAAECLGLSNVPAPAVLDAAPTGALVPHDPRWKAGVPRDAGAGWDFEDIRDHYFSWAVRAEPLEMRMVDPAGYLRWSGLVSGEVMTAAFSAWRRADSGCQGALVWWLRDLAPGAGWGVLDSESRPKPVYWALRRCLAPRAVLIDDRGLEGLDFLVFNDHGEGLDVVLSVELWQAGRVRTLRAERAWSLQPRSGTRIGTAELFGHFVDINHAYRFGPPAHDTVAAQLRDASGVVLAQAFHFPGGMRVEPASAVPQLRLVADGADRLLHLKADSMLLGVEIDAPGFEPEDNFFHLLPGCERVVRLRADVETPRVRVHCSAANLRDGATVRDA